MRFTPTLSPSTFGYKFLLNTTFLLAISTLIATPLFAANRVKNPNKQSVKIAISKEISTLKKNKKNTLNAKRKASLMTAKDRINQRVLAKLLKSPGANASSPTSNSTVRIGTNLGHLNESVMGCEGITNLANAGTEWVPQDITTAPWNTGEPFVALPEDGPPVTGAAQYAQFAATVLCNGVSGIIRPGKFVITFEGGSPNTFVQIGWAGSGLVETSVRRNESRRFEFDVRTNSNNRSILLRVNNPGPVAIRNLRVTRLENEDSTNFFTQEFIDYIKGIGFGTLRMLNLSGANQPTSSIQPLNSLSSHDRVMKGDIIQGNESKGMAIEYLAELAARTGTDLWYTVPYNASVDFIQTAVSIFDQLLPASATLYIEYGNENWNGQFAGTLALRSAGVAARLSSNEFTAGIRMAACKAIELADNARAALAARQSSRNLKVVLGFQNANTDTLTDPANFLCPNGRRAKDVVNMAASAPYYGNDDYFTTPSNASEMLSLGVNGLLLRLSLAADRTAARFASEVVPAINNLGLEATTYEGGSHLNWFPDMPSNLERPLTKLFTRVVEHPSMYNIHMNYVQAILAASGTGSHMEYRLSGRHNNFSTFGGLQSHLKLVAAGERPRLAALEDLIAEARFNASPALAQMAPSSVTGQDHEYLILKGSGFAGAVVEVAGIRLTTMQASRGVLFAYLPPGLAAGTYNVNVRQHGSELSNSLTLTVVPRAQGAARLTLTSLNAGTNDWDKLDDSYGDSLLISGSGFTTTGTELLVDGQALPRNSYTVVGHDSIIVNVLGELASRTHRVSLRDAGFRTQELSFGILRR